MISSCLICSKLNELNQLSYPYETFFNNKIYRYVKCSNCKSVYLLNDIHNDEIKKMYDEKSYHSIFYDSNKYLYLNSKIIDKINIFKTKSKLNICDFGCGNANLLNNLSVDFNKVGVEYSSNYVNYLQNNFKDITFLEIQNFLKKKEYENYFDIIYLGDVLEHLTAPHKIMSHLVSYLSNNGLFIIEGPIEENYNLIYYISKLVGYFKFLTGIKNSFVPYHIYRTNHNSQKLFFNNIKHLQINSYESYETGWPYKNNGVLRNFISIINFILFNKNKNRANRFICTLNKN